MRTYDPKSYELACHFTAGITNMKPETLEDMRKDLAWQIQQAVEDFLYLENIDPLYKPSAAPGPPSQEKS